MTARRREDIDDNIVHFMYEVEGMTQQEIADYYGVSQVTIYNRLNPDRKKEASSKWIMEHPEYNKEHYQEHSEEIKEQKKEYRKEHSEEIKEYEKEYYQEHSDEIIEQKKEYYQTDAGKVCTRKHNADRRDLGSIELNSPFSNSEGHHIDENYIIHIPKDLHHSIRHNVFTGQGMEAINEIAFRYITEDMFDKLIAGEI